ncbi:DNA mismatch repair protein msh6 [Aspergillus lentulus]|uniref:DNA mismatch repair protein n=1 Tax=Aspergillus lentulus TaxID=293939 RepID=A0ABQ0ZXL2_ASPLE|nr:DNA mismatch repair protein msh6 [Aspergillus lentulus]GFF24866.1 DNA mismatch repair protein msh6 [Aspergillus lentulus]GFF65629.1 DNA mismatch repair protein msh6 [Aspergillus lentulus]GFF68232.1 DNA mismatch repair protein msh6 [Aspergillus lentulus]
MAKGAGAASSPTTATPPSGALKRSTSSTQNMKNQRSILGFFQKSSPSTPSGARNVEPASSPAERASEKRETNASKATSKSEKKSVPRYTQNLTPVPSSDLVVPEEDEDKTQDLEKKTASPSRRAKKQISYAESESEGEDDDDVIFGPNRRNNRASKRRKVSPESEDEFEQGGEVGYSDDEMDDFIVADDSDEEAKPSKKRKRPSNATTRKASSLPAPPSPVEDLDLDVPDASSGTALKWTYDPENLEPRQNRVIQAIPKSTATPAKQKVHLREPEERYPWLANIRDIDGHPPDHPDYDPRTIYIPPLAWAKFSPFERQYWEIKQKFWDTVVFFKKGKFYELYENDATIGHQLFDLKLTDRVNMRMVGVPEMSLDHWANQFVAKGFKIARVDQSESALGKEMRERDGKKAGGKEDKIIKRELSCVLTAGTLVEGSMLQDDMSTYCVAIKEAIIDDHPAFGLAFVDTATGQFSLSEFVDDVDMTKFETFVAQTRPQELLLEKSTVSQKALRILKNNTGPTTIWNHLKPGKEFWEADITVKELDASEYFVSQDDDNLQAWPEALREAREKELVMSAVGALVQYLRVLKLDRDLITIGNFSWYDPIRKASSLVLDGQTLINMEIFANSFDGGSEGTLFQLLNRCITPFGKRMFKQWVCHPLMDAKKINARLDAVDALNADSSVRDQFSSQLTKMPDLERLISRIHAANCKAQDFVRVLEGFEQIEYTITLLKDSGSSGEGVIGQLISGMPDLSSLLEYWKTAFDRTKAKENGILVPKPGVEEDFDTSQERIEQLHRDLDNLLKRQRRELGSTAICYRDNGKEIYQLEVPIKVKNIPKTWDQMSATKQVKRYYFPELRSLIRKLQEAQETHSQIVKEVAGRFYARFDENYTTWLAAVRITSQLDCLISLAKASSSLGYPSCRPVFVEDERSVLEFEELRHPCLLSSVEDFIPNDVRLGGEAPNINLLTGANAAGKSTVLRMTCIAVIMAQIGCYLPCQSARLTPVDRIMSRLGANDNIFAAQSTFFVELSETKKILSEATPRSLVILDELGRGTSSYDGVAVAQAVLHHVATHIGAMGFFATHYHSLAAEFDGHPEITPKRMKIHVDDEERRITFLYKLEDGVAEGSFGMHCASMCGIPNKVIERAEVAAKQWEHTSRLKESLERRKGGGFVGLGWWSDVAWALRETPADTPSSESVSDLSLEVLRKAIEAL